VKRSRRAARIAALLLAVLGLGIAAIAAQAGGTRQHRTRREQIAIGRGIDGIRIGESETQLLARLGKPTSVSAPSWNYPRSLRGSVEFDYWHRVVDIYTSSRSARTRSAVGPGSTFKAMKRAYPGARCFAAPRGRWRRLCSVRAKQNGMRIESDFLFTANRVGMVEIFAIGNLPETAGMH